MANILRSPTIQPEKRWPGSLSQFSTVNLLTSTLFVAAAALPFNNAEALPRSAQHPSYQLSINADTSKGTAKTLIGDATPPLSKPVPMWVERTRFLNANTSVGTAKTLIADAIPPIINQPGFSPLLVRSVQDTTQKSQITLLSAVPSPIVNPIALVAERSRWLPSDTSKPTAKVLFADAQAPIVNPPIAPVALVRTVTDTTQDSPIVLLSAVPAPPIVNTFAFAPQQLSLFYVNGWAPPNLLTSTLVPVVPDNPPTGGGGGGSLGWTQWGGGGWSDYTIYDKEWQKTDWEKKIPPKVVQTIERIARRNQPEEDALRELEAELGVAEHQARYARMLTALMQSQFNSLQVLRKRQLRAIQENEDDDLLLFFT